MKILPTGDRILLKILKINELTPSKSGIIAARDMSGTLASFTGVIGVGQVIGLGQGYLGDKTEDGTQKWEPLESKVGDRIIFNARAGVAVTSKHRMIRESEIIARLTPEGTEIGDELLGGDDE